ncbi:hypothetical protein JG688_00004760, partial [Phytophthora aleatoria]
YQPTSKSTSRAPSEVLLLSLLISDAQGSRFWQIHQLPLHSSPIRLLVNTYQLGRPWRISIPVSKLPWSTTNIWRVCEDYLCTVRLRPRITSHKLRRASGYRDPVQPQNRATMSSTTRWLISYPNLQRSRV